MFSAEKKVIIFSAPSGAGKSTIVNHLIKKFPYLEFSISATSRPPRGEEKDGVQYYFLSADEFRRKLAEGEFVEYQEVYPGRFYGTLVKEVKRIWDKGNIILFDIDVQGGMNLKKLYGGNALSVFIQPPSVEVLRQRLVSRGTDSPEDIEKRVAKANEELSYSENFDKIIINDDLGEAFAEAEKIVENFRKGNK
jgi:guanylate kinase